MKKVDVIDRIFGKYIQKQIETNIKQIRKELIKENKETQFNNTKDTVTTAMNEEYKLLNLTKSCRFSGYIDLSSLRNGDILEAIVFFISTDGIPKRFFRKEFTNQQIDPIIIFDEKVVDGVIITVKQTAGTAGRPLPYNWRWQYI